MNLFKNRKEVVVEALRSLVSKWEELCFTVEGDYQKIVRLIVDQA